MEERGERGLGGEVGRVRLEEREGLGLGEGGGLGLEEQGGRSVDVGEGEGHAFRANAGEAQLRIRAELGPRPTGMQNKWISFAVLYTTEMKKTAFQFQFVFCGAKKPPTLKKRERSRVVKPI